MTTRQLRTMVTRVYPTACCARWRILGDHGDMQYRITAHHGIVGPVRQSIAAAWEAAAALLPNAQAHQTPGATAEGGMVPPVVGTSGSKDGDA